MTRLLAAALLALLAASAYAQLRTLPAQAKPGKMRHLQETIVQIDGKLARLAPGARIRDAHNRLVVPTAIPPDSFVKYTLDAQGHVSAVWILTPHEAANTPVTLPAPAKP